MPLLRPRIEGHHGRVLCLPHQGAAALSGSQGGWPLKSRARHPYLSNICPVSLAALAIPQPEMARQESKAIVVLTTRQALWSRPNESPGGRVIARALLASEESRICANYGNSCVAHVWPKQVRSMGWGVPPSREELLCISIVMTSVLGTCCTEAGSLRLGGSLVKAIMAQPVFSRLVLAVLPRQSLQRAMRG